MNASLSVDVLISGAGPAGTALAIDLVRRGTTVRIVDKAPHAFGGSRAKGVQPRTLEVLDDLGALDDVLAGGSLYPLLGLHAGRLSLPWRMMRNTEPTAAVPYPNTWLIPQFRTDSALHTRLRSLGQDVEFDTELIEVTQSDQAVIATLSTPAGQEQVTARYLVGADGGSSTVRNQLGIGFEGTTDEDDRMLIVDAVVPGLSRNRWHMWPPIRDRRLLAICPIPHSDLFQVILGLTPDEQPPADQDQVTQLVRERTGNRRISVHDIQWRSVFRPNIRLADCYRVGRVFLAGDAAHVHTPAGAQGLNTGVQDAYNLSWKLAQVVAGADDRLLDSYEAERRPIAARVLGLSTAKYDAIGSLDPSSIRRGADEQQLKLTYHGGPLAPGDVDRTAALRVGDRAPNAGLLDSDGRRARLFDIFRGPHFTCIAYGGRACAVLDDLEWPPNGATLTRVAVSGASPQPDRLADHVLTDTTATLREVYGLTTDTLLLVRPDGYIGHIATGELLASTQAAVRAMTPPTP